MARASNPAGSGSVKGISPAKETAENRSCSCFLAGAAVYRCDIGPVLNDVFSRFSELVKPQLILRQQEVAEPTAPAKANSS